MDRAFPMTEFRMSRETMHEMDAATLEELRVLRARAYGPHADIDQDPAAMQRLQELTAAAATGPGDGPRDSRDGGENPGDGRGDGAVQGGGEDPGDGRGDGAVVANDAATAGTAATARSATTAAPGTNRGSAASTTAGGATSRAGSFYATGGSAASPADSRTTDDGASAVAHENAESTPQGGPTDAARPPGASDAGVASGVGDTRMAADAALSAARSELSSDDPGSTHRPSSSPGTRRRFAVRVSRPVAVLWALSVVAAAALAAGITYVATALTPVPVSSGAPQIATLEPTDLIEVPAGWFGAGPSSRVFEFYGLVLFESQFGFGGAGTDCFGAVAAEHLPEPGADSSNWAMDGQFLTGCRVGAFPATIEMRVDSNLPQELRDRFPDGSYLQFVFDGDRIGVFLDSA
jgi:hypothetical protein